MVCKVVSRKKGGRVMLVLSGVGKGCNWRNLLDELVGELYSYFTVLIIKL